MLNFYEILKKQKKTSPHWYDYHKMGPKFPKN